MGAGKFTYLTYNGETKSVAEWAEICGVRAMTILDRLKRGHCADDVLKPIQRTRREGVQGGRSHSEQPCWSCEKACGKCSWSRKENPQPVPGWVAYPSRVLCARDRYVDSFSIRFCPEYKKERRKHHVGESG